MRLRGRFSARQLEEQVRTIRILGVLALGMILVAVACWAMRENRPADKTVSATFAHSVDPLRAEFERCNALGNAALEDDACRRAWIEQRRRFFAGSR